MTYIEVKDSKFKATLKELATKSQLDVLELVTKAIRDNPDFAREDILLLLETLSLELKVQLIGDVFNQPAV
jgi:hypothetical protein